MGDLIAERSFLTVSGTEVRLQIYAPVPRGEDGDFESRMVLTGLENEDWDMKIGGVDSLQALANALTFARRLLYINEDPVTWLNSGRVGLPMPEPLGWDRETELQLWAAYDAIITSIGLERGWDQD